jgi:hypothetical protein
MARQATISKLVRFLLSEKVKSTQHVQDEL